VNVITIDKPVQRFRHRYEGHYTEGQYYATIRGLPSDFTCRHPDMGQFKAQALNYAGALEDLDVGETRWVMVDFDGNPGPAARAEAIVELEEILKRAGKATDVGEPIK
jgi:hypothetical protein